MFISNVNRAQRFRARQATFSRLDHRLLMKLDMSKAREGQRVTKPCGTRRAAYRPDCGVLQGPAALTARRRKQLLFDREMDYVDIPLDHKIRGKVLSAASGSMTAPRRAGWRLTTDSVHAVGGKIFAQLWHVGRVSHTSLQPDGGAPRSATSRLAKDSIVFAYDANGKPGFVQTSTPSALSTMEVERVVEDFVSAAANAIEAGFDGVEIHAANGYLFEQFLNPLVNDRTDRYSATTRENQLRFALEVVDGMPSVSAPAR
jgi:hypothetical protein